MQRSVRWVSLEILEALLYVCTTLGGWVTISVSGWVYPRVASSRASALLSPRGDSRLGDNARVWYTTCGPISQCYRSNILWNQITTLVMLQFFPFFLLSIWNLKKDSFQLYKHIYGLSFLILSKEDIMHWRDQFYR